GEIITHTPNKPIVINSRNRDIVIHPENEKNLPQNLTAILHLSIKCYNYCNSINELFSNKIIPNSKSNIQFPIIIGRKPK
ncbi:hypothetical protein A3Q56_07880, partial [Intoshia linei]